MSDYVHVAKDYNLWADSNESEECEAKRLSEEALENEQALIYQEWEQQSLLIDQLNLEVETLRKVTIELISEKDRVIEEMERDKHTWFSNGSQDKADARAKLQQKKARLLAQFPFENC